MKIKLDNFITGDLKATTTTGTPMNAKVGSLFNDWAKEVGIVETIEKTALERLEQFERRCAAHPCAIESFFQKYPDVTSVNMTCSCPKCELTCY